MTKEALYDEICKVLTDYEDNKVGERDLYDTLVLIPNNWEAVVTAERKSQCLSDNTYTEKK